MIKYGLLAFVLGFGFSGAFTELFLVWLSPLADVLKEKTDFSQDAVFKKEGDGHEDQ